LRVLYDDFGDRRGFLWIQSQLNPDLGCAGKITNNSVFDEAAGIEILLYFLLDANGVVPLIECGLKCTREREYRDVPTCLPIHVFIFASVVTEAGEQRF
jgi:hypothetical protein